MPPIEQGTSFLPTGFPLIFRTKLCEAVLVAPFHIEVDYTDCDAGGNASHVLHLPTLHEDADDRGFDWHPKIETRRNIFRQLLG
jgi:hypothetical protein